MDESWMNDANCRTAPLYLFFPQPGEDARVIVDDYCRDCPVRRECITFAYTTNQVNPLNGDYIGTWGATARELKEARRRARKVNGRDWIPYAVELAIAISDREVERNISGH